MFRATRITSAVGGLLLGSLIGINERSEHSFRALQAVIVFVFFGAGFLLVFGLPQYREAMARRAERAACREIHRVDHWQRFGSDMRLFHVPYLCRMLTFLFCAIIADILVRRL